MARARFDAGTARCALVLIDLGQPSLWVHLDGIEVAGTNAVAATETSVAAAGLATSCGVYGRASHETVVLGHAGPQLACAIAPHDSHKGLAVGRGYAEEIGHLVHNGLPSDGTEQSFERTAVAGLDQCTGHVGTSGESASATVGTRKNLLNLSNARIFINSKLLGACVEHDSGYQTNGSENEYCTKNKIHNILVLSLYR